MRKSATLLLIPVLLVSMFLIQFYVAATSNVSANSRSDDWPMFRHDPAHTGVTTSAGPTEPVELWRFPEGNFEGFFIGSSAAVVNGIVYVGSTYNQETRQGGAIYALNAYTGEKIWEYTTSSVRSSPAVSGNIVYVGSGDDNLYALSAATGKKIWSAPILNLGEKALEESPSVADGVVYIGSEGFGLWALNASTGAQIWNNNEDFNFVYSSAAVVDGVVYIANLALNASTGAKIWSFPVGHEINASPAVSNGVVYIAAQDGNFNAIGEPLTAPSPSPSPNPSVPTTWIATAIALLAVFGVALLIYFIKRRH